MTRSQETASSLPEVLEFVRTELAGGFDLMLTNEEGRLLLAEIDNPRHPDQCACEDCITDAMREHEATQERELDEQQADEDRAQEVAENGVLPWE